MPRRSSRSGGGARRTASPRARPASRSASTRSRAPPPARTSSTAPAATKQSSTSPQATKPAQQGSAMGGFMSNVASTGMGVMAGRAMDRAFFGGSGGAAAQEGDHGAEAYATEGYEADEAVSESVCAREALEFKKCMENSGSNVAACQWNIDVLAACQQREQQLGFADAGRF